MYSVMNLAIGVQVSSQPSPAAADASADDASAEKGGTDSNEDPLVGLK
jgi:hypothetical protein